jgi:hypothetical protein
MGPKKLTHPFYHVRIQQKDMVAGCQWLTPVILATKEAEIRKIVV